MRQYRKSFGGKAVSIPARITLLTLLVLSMAVGDDSIDESVFERFCAILHTAQGIIPEQLKEFATQLQTFFAASVALDNHLENLDLYPKDDSTILSHLSKECNLCAERCQILLTKTLKELDASRGGPSGSVLQLYHILNRYNSQNLQAEMNELLKRINLRMPQV